MLKEAEGKRDGIDISRLKSEEEFIGLTELYNRLKIKYSEKEIIDSLVKEETMIPASIFVYELSSFEAIVKYLFENKGFSLKKISVLLSKSNRNIWNTYDKSRKKHPKKLFVEESILIPVFALSNSKNTLFENLVIYMKDELGLNYHDIGIVLHRNDRTIWTIYNRKKNG